MALLGTLLLQWSRHGRLSFRSRNRMEQPLHQGDLSGVTTVEDPAMIDPDRPDPYVDEVLHNPGEPAPRPEPEQEAPDWPDGQVPPEEQSDG